MNHTLTSLPVEEMRIYDLLSQVSARKDHLPLSLFVTALLVGIEIGVGINDAYNDAILNALKNTVHQDLIKLKKE